MKNDVATSLRKSLNKSLRSDDRRSSITTNIKRGKGVNYNDVPGDEHKNSRQNKSSNSGRSENKYIDKIQQIQQNNEQNEDNNKKANNHKSNNNKPNNSKSIKQGGGVGGAACLLVNDENPRLPEWIAYHYHILPLRHLIVAVDPGSRVSPSEILGRWADDGLNMGLNVKIWDEDDYLPSHDAHGHKIKRGACGKDGDGGNIKVSFEI